MTTTQRTSLLTGMDIDELPDDARQALHDGTDWESIPDSIEYGTEDVYYCDDCDDWHRYWFVYGVRIEGGKVYDVMYHVDADGDWSFEDQREWGQDWRDYDSAQTSEHWREYYRFVAKTGRDSLYSFTSSRRERWAEDWRIKVRASILGPVLLGAAPLARTEKRAIWMPVENMPEVVRSWLMLGQVGPHWIITGEPGIERMSWPDFEKLDSIRWTQVRGGTHYGVITVEGYDTITTSTHDIIQAAKRALEEEGA
jgi:hypothetical protein